ncbi:hypothetical protein AAE478_006767 [Parahypoxylon ruwenzoriense]
MDKRVAEPSSASHCGGRKCESSQFTPASREGVLLKGPGPNTKKMRIISARKMVIYGRLLAKLLDPIKSPHQGPNDADDAHLGAPDL